jgi:phage tail protein X
MNGKNTVISKEGDTISLLAYNYYGSSREMVEEILEANPHLSRQSAILPAGVIITMPKVDVASSTILPSFNLWD